MVGRSESCVCRHIDRWCCQTHIHVIKIMGKQTSVINERLHLCTLSSHTRMLVLLCRPLNTLSASDHVVSVKLGVRVLLFCLESTSMSHRSMGPLFARIVMVHCMLNLIKMILKCRVSLHCGRFSRSCIVRSPAPSILD